MNLKPGDEMDKLQERIREVEEEFAGEMVARNIEFHTQKFKEDSLVLLGAIRATDRWATLMSSGAMKALIRFQEEKRHEAFGYDRFAYFLAKSEHAPMTKAQFYERKALLEKEGERLFDIFSEMGLSVRKRKLLGQGNVEIDGENAIIRDEDGLETIVPINDQSRLMEVVTAVVDSKIALQHKFERQQEKEAKHEEKVRELYGEIDQIKASKAAEFAADPHMIARVELGLSFAKLAKAVKDLSPVEKDQFKDSVLEDVAAWSTTLRGAYLTPSNRSEVPDVKPGEWDGLTEDEIWNQKLPEFIDGVLEHEADNDAELAASM